MDAALLARELEEFLAISPRALVLEEGEILFDLNAAKYSVSGDEGKCLLHLWSSERNAVRRVLEVERRQGQLRISVQRFGKGKPTILDVIPDRDRRPTRS
jgi:hypothetical protein